MPTGENPYQSPNQSAHNRQCVACARGTAIAACAALCGYILALVDANYLSPFRSYLFPWQDVSADWALFWISSTAWLMAVMAGAVIGICIRQNWLVASVACGITLVSAPHLIMTVEMGASALSLFGADVFLIVLSYQLPSVVLMVVSAFSSARIFCRRRQHPLAQ